jgi:hypothetical protein
LQIVKLSGPNVMLMRRLAKHARTHDWFAVVLDLAIVVVGIVIGFQVDRWYEVRQSERAVASHLEAIAADFEENQRRLSQALGYTARQIEAAVRLRQWARKQGAEVSAAELNALFSALSGLPTFEAVDFAYRNLLASREAAAIQSWELRRELAGFYSAYELTKTIQNSQELHYSVILQPYVIRHLDYAASGRPGSATAEDRADLGPPQNPGLILDVLQTQEFLNVVVAQWERAIDLRENYEELLERAIRIENLLTR